MLGTTVDEPFEEMSVLDIGPTDTILLRSKHPLNRDQRKELLTYFQDLFPTNRVLILDQDLELVLLRGTGSETP